MVVPTSTANPRQRASQPADLLKFIESHAAILTLCLLNRCLDRLLTVFRQTLKQIGNAEALLHLRAFFLSAVLTEIQLTHLIVHNLGQMNGRFLFPACISSFVQLNSE